MERVLSERMLEDSEGPENPFLEILQQGMEHSVHKWNHYLPLYHRHFKKYRKKASPKSKIRMLEIGVAQGGSLELWSKYFGPENCEIYGVDIEPSCKGLESHFTNVKIYIGDQANREFLENLKNEIPFMDIIIDDGGHTMIQQINSFEVLFEHVKPGGIYLCEDTHTSYGPYYGGGYKKEGTFIEYSKNLVDKLMASFIHGTIPMDSFVSTCLGIYYYDSMVFFEKSNFPLPPPCVTLWHPWMTFYYGTEENYKNVTHLVFTHCIHGDILKLPRGDITRANIFGDPIVGILKHIKFVDSSLKKETFIHDNETFTYNLSTKEFKIEKII